MATDGTDREGLGDDQGTRVGRPESEKTRASKGKPTGAGAEAAGGAQEAPIDGHDEEHKSGYGGAGGSPKRGGETG
ncbi:MAG TPA: hypothetical protein VEA99_09965 [Gemmatimonadaceae bacterium]|nr:hypothetical protein [Gemmatimonadaceae bacterium]